VRQEHGHQLAELASSSTMVRPVRVEVGVPSYLRYPVLTADRRLCSADARRLGIMPGYPLALVDLAALTPVVRNRDDRFPGARLLVEELVTLPTHGQLSTKDRDQLALLIG